MESALYPGNLIRRRDAINHQSIHVKPFVVKNRLRHRDLFEQEYRCTEYEYVLSDVYDSVRCCRSGRDRLFPDFRWYSYRRTVKC